MSSAAEKEFKTMEISKKANARSRIEENESYIKLVSQLKDFPNIKIDLDDLVEQYMNATSSGTKLENGEAIKISDSIIDELVEKLRKEISIEENGVVFDDNGEIDEELSEAQFEASFHPSSIIDDNGRIEENSVVKREIKNIEDTYLNSYAKICIRQMYFDSNMNEEEKFKSVEKIVNSKEYDYKVDKNRNDSYIKDKEEVKKLCKIDECVNLVNSPNPEESQKGLDMLDELKEEKGFEEFRDEDGTINLKKMTEYITLKRNSYMTKEYLKELKEFSNSRIKFDDLDSIDQIRILNGIYRLSANNAKARIGDEGSKNDAIAVLMLISPALVEVDGNGDVSISTDKFKNFYNSYLESGSVTKVEDIEKRAKQYEEQQYTSHIRKLDKEIEMGVFREIPEWKKITEKDINRAKKMARPRMKSDDSEKFKLRFEKITKDLTPSERKNIILAMYKSEYSKEKNSPEVMLLKNLMLNDRETFGTNIKQDRIVIKIKDGTLKKAANKPEFADSLKLLEDYTNEIDIRKNRPFSLENFRNIFNGTKDSMEIFLKNRKEFKIFKKQLTLPAIASKSTQTSRPAEVTESKANEDGRRAQESKQASPTTAFEEYVIAPQEVINSTNEVSKKAAESLKTVKEVNEQSAEQMQEEVAVQVEGR